MPCVSDTGATAPISALTYAFSIGSDQASSAAGFARESSMGAPQISGRVVNQIDNFWPGRCSQVARHCQGEKKRER